MAREGIWIPRWKIRIEGRERGHAFYQAYWTTVARLGPAIDLVLLVARRCGIDAPIARAALPIDIVSFLRMKDPETRPTCAAGVRCGERWPFPLEQTFVPPPGIIESCACSDLATTRMEISFARVDFRESGCHLEVIVDREQVELVLGSLFALLPRIICFGVVLVPLQPRRSLRLRFAVDVSTSGAAMRLLLDDRRNLLDNGLVSIFAATDRWNSICLSEHKVVRVSCRDRGLLSRVEERLQDLGIPERDSVLTLADVPHHRYRPRGSSRFRNLWHLLAEEGLTEPMRIKLD